MSDFVWAGFGKPPGKTCKKEGWPKDHPSAFAALASLLLLLLLLLLRLVGAFCRLIRRHQTLGCPSIRCGRFRLHVLL
jgi:hypothetical protein